MTDTQYTLRTIALFRSDVKENPPMYTTIEKLKLKFDLKLFLLNSVLLSSYK